MGVSPTNPSTSPVRSTSRSFTQPIPIHIRTPQRPTNLPSEPRIVRAESSRNHDSAFLPSSPTSVRKPSIAGLRTSSTQRAAQGTPQPVVTSSASFERPAYLDHSALRHLLQTETPASLPPPRKPEPRPSSNTRAYSSTPSTDSDDDSTASPPPREIPVASTSASASTPVIAPDQVLKLPTRWSDVFRHHYLSLSEDGRELTYQGIGHTDRERESAAAARTHEPIPPACGIYYYEVDIRSKDQKANISVGFAGSDVRTSRLPGWEPNSWGYHGDDGCSFAAEKNGTKYGPTFGANDTIGCGIDFTNHRAFYTKNGVMLGPVFENVGKRIDLYPSIGLQLAGESVKVNFGHEPFKYDIEAYVQLQRNQTWTEIIQRPIEPSFLDAQIGEDFPSPPPPEERTQRTLNRLVLSYLAHHGYVKTARAFQKQAEGTSPSPAPPPSISTVHDDVEMVDVPSSSSTLGVEAEIELRTRIVNSVLERDIDSALRETQANYPAVFEAEESLMLVKLRCRKFIELLLDAAELKKSLNSSDEVDEGMEVDDGPTTNGFSTGAGHTLPRESSAHARCRAALSEAIAYGQSLQVDYKKDTRPEVQGIFMRTFSIVAYEDPLAIGGSVAEVVGNEARVQLANELNQAILKSQGKPTHPPLEMMYRYTATYLLELGLSGVGAAAFADLQRELLDS
ncbi:hypothetical protein V5O48_000673 [Marasmius crinis-equi]|uniref:SPRY-domain-containing protein n=1 Tax=Marasmius crinis-equi TaxID=585013 RepID=A0ABR3G0N9_9AGAR